MELKELLANLHYQQQPFLSFVVYLLRTVIYSCKNAYATIKSSEQKQNGILFACT